ncbi:MAG: DUF456 domain-containing protein [Akkermansia sp.]|nr:DUF456 domain-containing protein [Akkermansia sp.]MBQ4594811.1 DUF456 domain-containing protein [Akkermansia sp.]
MLQEMTNWVTGQDYVGISLYISAALLYMAGFLGAVLPYPGCFVALGGSVCYALAAGEPYPAWWVWLILLLLAIFGTLADNITTAMGAKKFGGSWPAFWCSMAGLFVGAFFFPFGLIIGPFLGAFFAETVIVRKTLKDSAKASMGATIGLLAGVLAKVIITAIMLVVTLI